MVMEVSIWGSDWGLASVDPLCLQMITYAKFSGAPLQVKETNNPFWTPKSNLPVFRHESTSKDITDFSLFVNHLRKCNFSANYNLSAKQLSEVNALCNLIDEKLYPAYLYIFWLDAKNHVELVRPWYAKRICFPLNVFYIPKLHQHAVDVIEGRFECHVDDPALEPAVYKSAEQTLTLLSRRLGTEPYLFGKSPTSADAMLYAHLAPILKAPLPNPSLQNHLKSCSNLVAFVGRITQTHFAQISIDYEKKLKTEKEASDEKSNAVSLQSIVSTLKSKDFINRAGFGILSFAAMMGYAHFSGLLGVLRSIEVRYVDDEDEEYDEEENDFDNE